MAIISSYVPEKPDLKPLVAIGRQMLADGRNLDAVLRYLRSQGCLWGDCIDAAMLLTGMPHRDAKRAVYQSDTWRDLRPVIDELHDSIERAVDEMQAAGEIEVRVVDHATKSGAA